jgi:hypothetical protein
MLKWPDTIQVDLNSSLTLHTPEKRTQIPVSPKDAIAEQLEEFARCIRGEANPETGAKEGITAVSVVEVAIESYKAEARLEIPMFG